MNINASNSGSSTLEVQRAKSKANKCTCKVPHDMTRNCLADMFTYKSEIMDHDLRGSPVPDFTSVTISQNRKFEEEFQL